MSYIHQQINLYQPLFRKQKKLFSFSFSVQAVVIFFFALFCVYLLNLQSNAKLKKTLSDAEALNKQRLGQLANLSNEIAKYKGSSQNSRADQLKQELEAESFLLSVLGDIYQSHSKGFAAYLEGFSRGVIDGLWISRFDMQNGGRDVQLMGGALKPDAVPRFIDNLKQEQVLLGTNFQVLEIDRSSENKGWVQFKLASDKFTELPFDVQQSARQDVKQ